MRRFLFLAALVALAGCGDEPGDPAPVVESATQAPPVLPTAGDPPPRLPGPPSAARGGDVYRRLCAACHGPRGDGHGSVNLHYLERMDPDLALPDLTRPARGVEGTRRAILEGGTTPWMPAYARTLDPEATDDLMAFLETLPGRPPFDPVNLSTAPEHECSSCHHVEGIELVRQANCAGCHAIAGLERRAVAPDLGGAGRKFTRPFLYEFLRRPWNRRQVGFRPMEIVRMPNYELSADEALDLTEYLASREEIDLPEPWSAPDLPAEAIQEQGQRLLDARGCLACHKLGRTGGKIGPDLTWLGRGDYWRPEWVVNWLLDPQRYLPGGMMPDPGLTPDEARLLTAFLLTGGLGERPERHGRPAELEPGRVGYYPDLPAGERALRSARGAVLFEALACIACHPDGQAAYEPARHRVGPRLDDAPLRLDRDWFHDLLNDPHDRQVRPGLAPARMPYIPLTRDEYTSLLGALEDRALARWPDARRRLEERLAAVPGPADPIRGRRLFVEKDCHSCHRVGDDDLGPVGSYYFEGPEQERRRRRAPDLAGSRERLARWWAFGWLLDPKTFDPEPLMPEIEMTDEEAARILDYLLGGGD